MNTPDPNPTEPAKGAREFENSVDVPHDTAEMIERDLKSPGTRKPASEEVENERSARARARAEAERPS